MSRSGRPAGYMVYGIGRDGEPGTGRYVPAETRAQAARRRWLAWSEKTAWTNGEFALFAVLATAGGGISWALDWAKWPQAFFAPASVVVLTTAGVALARRFGRQP